MRNIYEEITKELYDSYNSRPRKEWISESIGSVLNQSYPNIELIIINDASKNDVEKVILDYKIKNVNIIYLKNDKNCERSYSRNR
jgi:glycosyltransferase involved in cell wall biosynthesis